MVRGVYWYYYYLGSGRALGGTYGVGDGRRGGGVCNEGLVYVDERRGRRGDRELKALCWCRFARVEIISTSGLVVD